MVVKQYHKPLTLNWFITPIYAYLCIIFMVKLGIVMIVLPTLVNFDRDAIVFFGGHPATRHFLVKDTNKKPSEHIDFGYPTVKMI